MPSEKVLQVKQNYVAELAEKLKKSACGVLVDYSGITVADDTVLRKELREAGVDYFVVKNTLLSVQLRWQALRVLMMFSKEQQLSHSQRKTS